MSVLSPAATHADRSLAHRDAALPGLPWLLDNTRLSELLGETVRVTRVRYKPGHSLLVAFRRLRNGTFDYGWAYTMTAPAEKLLRRESTSRSRGGNMRILRIQHSRDEVLVAVGEIGDDWALRRNLKWLRQSGAEQLGLHAGARTALPGGSAVLRYKPERRLVLLARNASADVVIKTAAERATPGQQAAFLDRLRHHGVPILPQLANAECLAHGVSASTAWGTGDLSASKGHTDALAYKAGQALAALHRFPAADAAGTAPTGFPEAAGNWLQDHTAQLKATRTMVSALLPEQEPLARQLESRLASLLLERPRTAPVLVHGDFSADQVLVGDSEVRLIDFDRARTGMAEADLGSFAAAEEAGLSSHSGSRARGAPAGGPKTALLADGYLDAGGRLIQSEVDVWAAFRLFNSSVDTFRDRAPEWAADMSWHLSRAKELIP
ncbi:aminoglycoside phosphotransferase family protein [Arthrobacter pascens]|uniref:aminoglycoside phosphotransferase family protein n=1 Tax=Arthrobacter pascens TaxID=1677 RepID=UPI00196A580F|nr:aminoglycoside phosphotransferase family protein [Arthrobacter pascens]MBN3496673.1 aminoglycoside phosphotransferase family protein [Arthrobacter pascens]